MVSVHDSPYSRVPALAARRNRCAAVLVVLSLLFALRLFAQALQYWAPHPLLPPFNRFQGSDTPYWLLLPVQVLIFALMILATLRIGSGAQQPNLRAGRVFAWIGGIYMTGSIARIVIGLAHPAPALWFTAWIPAIFHVVLAGFIVTLAAYHAIDPIPLNREVKP